MTRVTTDVDALNDLFAAGVVTMINDFFLLAVMVGLLFKIDARLALDAMAVLPFILVVTLVFRKYVRDANRKIRTAIARINAFLQEYISGMSVVQLFNSAYARIATKTTCWRGVMRFSRMRCSTPQWNS
jgi:ATP-binding cassette subfamily B protein